MILSGRVVSIITVATEEKTDIEYIIRSSRPDSLFRFKIKKEKENTYIPGQFIRISPKAIFVNKNGHLEITGEVKKGH